MCHSDEHIVTGDLAGATPPPPVIGGHEGAGVVVEVGEGVDWLAPGDHVVFAFVPACGRCEMCVTGHSNLCDNAAAFPTGRQIGDGTARQHGPPHKRGGQRDGAASHRHPEPRARSHPQGAASGLSSLARRCTARTPCGRRWPGCRNSGSR